MVDTEPNDLYRVHELLPGRAPARTLLAGARRGYVNAPCSTRASPLPDAERHSAGS
ncbi:hypothetical protein [Streptomyces parvus]|uniref:hypothetical protein n=1 Tax=Streptomyces parvus TaxID=66428 RepID=UPI003332234F